MKIIITSMKYFEFIFHYALRELFPISFNGNKIKSLTASVLHNLRTCIPTFINILVITLMIITVLSMWGIMTGTELILNKSLEKDSRLLSIDAFCGGTGTEKSILRAKDIKIIENITDRNNISMIEGVCGWNDVSVRFFKLEKNHLKLDDIYRDGRTVNINDKILLQLKYDVMVDKKRKNNNGIIIGRSLLHTLGYPDDEKPKVLFIQYKGKKSPLPVLGIVKNLWNGDFLMPEKFWREYQSLSWIPEPSHLDFYLGPVNSKNILSIKKSLDKVCDLDSMKINVCERAGETFWLHFLLSGKGWTEKYIRNEFAKGLYVNIGKEYLKFLKNSRIEMGNASLQEERIGFKRGLDDYNSVTVFVKNIDNVLKVMKKLKNMGMNCDNRLAEDIIWANQLKQFSSRLFFVVVGTVSLLVLINIYLSFTQKIHSSIPEIGILKAFGHGGLTIIIIQVVETFIIWLIAMPLGTFAAFYAGKQTETFIINTFHLDVQLRMFVLTPEIILITGIASLAAAGFAAVVAAFFAALKNPSEALSYKK